MDRNIVIMRPVQLVQEYNGARWGAWGSRGGEAGTVRLWEGDGKARAAKRRDTVGQGTGGTYLVRGVFSTLPAGVLTIDLIAQVRIATRDGKSKR